ncbi:MAG: hypothetical protein GXO09_01635 [Crenarchaeota archaeon]|nr:hypothetical protein [Thermoproteota archaeon]
MTTAREAFVAKKLRQRYGVVGSVAGLYVRAGYSVRVGVQTKAGVADVFAVKEGVKLAIKVLTESKPYGRDVVELAKKIAGELGAKPVIVLYGAGPRLTEEAVKAAEEAGVSVRRVRPGH